MNHGDYERDLLGELHAGYKDHSATLKKWFAGYAGGVPAFLALNQNVWAKVLKSGLASTICGLIFAGIFIQIAVLLIYKTSNSIGWLAAKGRVKEGDVIYKVSKSITGGICFDVITDVLTLILFTLAGWLVFRLIQNP